MASSKKSLDIDTLTFQTLYIKAQSIETILSYTIPMIPGGDTVLKKLIYLTPHQALSVADIYITPSTIPEILSSIATVSSSVNSILYAVSTVSSSVGYDVSSINATTSLYTSSIYQSIYNSTYSTLAGTYTIVQYQNVSTLTLQSNVFQLSYTVSTLSSAYISSFAGLYTILDVDYNQGPAVSVMSTYVSQYFSTLYFNIPYFSTSIGASISTTTVQCLSSMIGYSNDITAAFGGLTTAGVSTMSTVITSTFISYDAILVSYNPSYGISSISTTVVSTLASYSTLFSYNSGIPGICSLSTSINLINLSNINSIPDLAGVPGLCTMSTYLNTSVMELGSNIGLINTGATMSTFSTSLYTTMNQLNYEIKTVGYVNTILQQEAVKISLSTLSTSFGLSYIQMTSMSTISSIVPNMYSTASTLFSLATPYSTIKALSTVQGSNFSTLTSTIVNTNSGPGISSLSTIVSLSFSTLSTTMGYTYQSYSNLTSSIISSFTSTTVNLISTYNSISTIVYQNLFSPVFSSFTTDSIYTSTLTARNLIVSSLGVNQSTSIAFPFAVIGGAQILPALPPPISYVKIGLSTFCGSSSQTGYTSTTTNQFTGQGNGIAYNGALWVAVGSNTVNGNLIKYSSTPSVSWSNATYPSVGPSTMNTVKWNGSYWLAGGSGASINANNLLQSSNGSSWSYANPTTMMSSIQGLAWNGYKWVAVGTDPVVSSILYTDTNGLWQQTTNAFTSRQGNDVTTNGRIWVAVGNGSSGLDSAIKYSYDALSWSNVVGPQLSTTITIAWNGDKFIAGGSNGNSSNVVYSFDGVNWTYSGANVAQQATSLLWDGSQWSLTGLNDSTHFVSADGIQWTPSALTDTGVIYGQAYAANTIPTIQLSNFDIYSQETPVILNGRKRMNIIQSSIFFNDGDLTIRRIPSTIAYACIGINNTYPTMALDIGYGDARKPSGTAWLTASDSRVKENIVKADLASCAKLVADIPLRQYSFTKEFQNTSRVSADLHYGFIAQEVKGLLPNSIRYSQEFGFNDFHSLDTDQIFKAEFGATQYLLQRLHEMEAQVSTLESRLKSPAA